MAKKQYKFNKSFEKNHSVFSAPIILELMGSYIEHTGGNKLICLLDLEVKAKVNRKDYSNVNFIFENEEIKVEYDDITITNEKTMHNLVKIVINELKEYGIDIKVGIDGIIESISEFTGLDLIPSYIWLFVDIISLYNHMNLKKEELIVLSNNVLNKYNQTNIPAELSLYNCSTNHALYQNLRKNEIKKSLVNFEDFSIVICYDKEIKKDLTQLYTQRVNDSISAHMIIDSKFKHECLSDFSMYELNEVKEDIRDFEFKRMRHAISENNRVDELYESLDKDDIVKTGMLFSQSHFSILQDYEVTTQQQNSMYSLASNWNVLGAKMIASKYNSSIFVLVKDIQIPTLTKEVSQLYKERFKSQIEFLICNIH